MLLYVSLFCHEGHRKSETAVHTGSTVLRENTSIIVCIFEKIPGVGLENKGHQGSHVFNSKGVLLRHVQLQLCRGIKFNFIVITELEGLIL